MRRLALVAGLIGVLLVAGCTNPFEPAKPPSGTGGGVVEDFTTPTKLFNTLAAAIAAKAVKEVRYHLQHAAEWVVRLGDGSEESTRRMQAALTQLWPYVNELFAADDVDIAADTSGLARRTQASFTR